MADAHAGGRGLRVLRLQRVLAGKEGLPKFKADLEQFIKHTLSQKYNGKSAPRLVLFSPIAQEEPKGRDLPDPTAKNERIKLYTERDGRGRQGQRRLLRRSVHPRPDLHERHLGRARGYTINGIHLNPTGNNDCSPTIICRPASRTNAVDLEEAGEAPQGRPRQEFLLVQPLPDRRRLLDLRRPGRSRVRRRPDQPRGRPARDGSPRRDDGQPRQEDLGRGAGQGLHGRRQQHARRSSRSSPTSPAPGRTGRTSSSIPTRNRSIR